MKSVKFKEKTTHSYYSIVYVMLSIVGIVCGESELRRFLRNQVHIVHLPYICIDI